MWYSTKKPANDDNDNHDGGGFRLQTFHGVPVQTSLDLGLVYEQELLQKPEEVSHHFWRHFTEKRLEQKRQSYQQQLKPKQRRKKSLKFASKKEVKKI